MLHLLIVAFAQLVTKVKVQQSLYWPIAGQRFFQEDEAPRFPDIRHMKVVRLSALHTVHLFIIIGIQPLGQFGQRPELSQGTGMALVCTSCAISLPSLLPGNIPGAHFFQGLG